MVRRTRLGNLTIAQVEGAIAVGVRFKSEAVRKHASKATRRPDGPLGESLTAASRYLIAWGYSSQMDWGPLGSNMTNRKFLLYTAAITALALLIRLHYVLTAEIVNPLGGDAREYVGYAQNILRGYFGIGAAPDAYRSPGYPTLVSAAMSFGGNWYPRLQLWQAALGAGTVTLTAYLGRRFVPVWGALAAATLLALWPHHIAFSAEILSEVSFGFCLMGALLLTALALERQSTPLGAGAGVAWATTGLINPISILLPFVIAASAWLLAGRRAVVIMLAPALLGLAAWSMRPAEGGSERVWVNLVQGSWPLYHRAYVSRNAHPEPARIIAEIDAESTLAVKDHIAGLESIASRFKSEPVKYVRWYATKPYLLWDWDIRISDAFGPYVHVARRSILETVPLSWVKSAAKAVTPLFFWLSLAGCALAFVRGTPAARMVTTAFVYFTVVHWVLQAEPRYSVPYRAIQLMISIYAVCALTSLARTRSLGTAQPVV